MRAPVAAIALACLVLAGVATGADKQDPFRINKRDFKKQYKVIALTPVDADPYLQMPDSVARILEQEITAHLQKRGYTVIPSSVLAGIRKTMEAQVGGFEDPDTGQTNYEKINAVREHAFRELWFTQQFDALASIRVTVTRVDMESDKIEWDGVRQRLDHDGSSKKYSANVAVSSVALIIFDDKDDPLFANYGGLEPLMRRTKEQVVPVDVDKLFQDEELIRKAAEVAVDPI